MQPMSVTGIYEHNMDAKGRLFIPAKLREDLGANAYLSIGKSGCLAIYTQESWEKLTQRYDEAEGADKTALRPIFAYSSKCEPDSQGRIVIPQVLREFAKLEKEVVVTGANDKAEIWRESKWQEMYGTPVEEDITSMLEKLGL